MTGKKVLSFDKDLEKLPVGAVVINGDPLSTEYVFAKVSKNRWKLYDIENASTGIHDAFIADRPEWGAEEGFPKLNLPVFLLTKTGNREELEASYDQWRKKE